uniref:Protein phosphatase 1 regulatory subunit 1A n=1 Tax=Calidris pygmaea TaxID=425635 RepID=A0A8C3JBA1_9CHAR
MDLNKGKCRVLPLGRNHPLHQDRPNSPRKIQFTVPLLEPHLDPEAAEQIRRRRPTPANLVLSSDQSSPGRGSRSAHPSPGGAAAGDTVPGTPAWGHPCWHGEQGTPAVTFKSSAVTGPTQCVAFGEGGSDPAGGCVTAPLPPYPSWWLCLSPALGTPPVAGRLCPQVPPPDPAPTLGVNKPTPWG